MKPVASLDMPRPIRRWPTSSAARSEFLHAHTPRRAPRYRRNNPMPHLPRCVAFGLVTLVLGGSGCEQHPPTHHDESPPGVPAEPQPQARRPLRVLHAGCAEVLPGGRCELGAEGSELTLWVEVDEALAVHVAID